jgi:predicted lipoprotein with Yx(FWY)xxD motif
MIRVRTAVLAACLAGAVAGLAGCSSGDGSKSATKASADGSVHYVAGTVRDNSQLSGTGATPASEAAGDSVQLSVGASGALNPVVHDGAGFTLYRFDKDTAHPSKSNCNGACAVKWPPVLVRPNSRIFLDGVSLSKAGTVRRQDGTLQVTIGGWPAYRFSKDTAAGQTNGQGVGGTWFAVTPDGKKAGQSAQGRNSATGLDYKNGTAAQNHAAPNTGDFYNGPSNNPAAMKWVQLTAGSANGLNPIVHNGAGFTLYRFNKDTAHPSKSNCNGACAVTWPPVLVRPGSRIFVDGVDTDQIGIVRRADGTRQVTIGGWPIYRFSKDTAPHQTNGEGVGGTWFAVSPTGGKVLPPAPATPPAAPAAPASSAPAAGSAVTLGNGSVILDSGINLTEPNGSEGVSGPGCQNVGQPGLASSLQLSGGPVKIWTGPDCTGTSKVVTGDVDDLSTIGFDKKIVSIRFGG